MRRTLITLVLSILALVVGLSVANPAYASGTWENTDGASSE